ncbi:MAG: DUF2283 domain-containing protein [Methylomonas sp.]|jgi:uncharacterized protein YuzE
MKLSYDKKTDPSVDSDEVAEGVVLDFDSNGVLVGIDIQNASQKTDVAIFAHPLEKVKISKHL